MQIGFSRKQTPMKVTKDGGFVGEIYRVANGHFAVQLDGIYWDRLGNPTRKGGASALGFSTLREAKARAVAALQSI